MPEIPHTRLFSRKISDFCRLRVDPVLPPQESERIRNFLVGLISRSQIPPRKLQGYDWEEIAYQCDLDKESLRIARAAIKPALDAIVRNTASSPTASPASSPGSAPADPGSPRRSTSLKAQRVPRASYLGSGSARRANRRGNAGRRGFLFHANFRGKSRTYFKACNTFRFTRAGRPCNQGSRSRARPGPKRDKASVSTMVMVLPA